MTLKAWWAKRWAPKVSAFDPDTLRPNASGVHRMVLAGAVGLGPDFTSIRAAPL